MPYICRRIKEVIYTANSKQLEIMTITNTITGTSVNTDHTNYKWAKTYINQEVIWMNELESDKPKEERHYYTSLDFKITE